MAPALVPRFSGAFVPLLMVGRRCMFWVRLQEMTPTLAAASTATAGAAPTRYQSVPREFLDPPNACLLYTSDAADEL